MGRMHGLEKIVRVCSHQQSLAQCRQWLDEYLPNAERVPVSSNAEAARRARDEDGTAAIAGQAAAEVYGLNIIVPEIEDARTTPRASSSSAASCSAPAATTRRPARIGRRHAVARCAAPPARPASGSRHQHDAHRVAPSRRRKWDYVFFIDVVGHAEQHPLSTALAELKKQTSLFRVLGSYPCAVL
jgi:chorismate mutase/prephenate dehydratase